MKKHFGLIVIIMTLFFFLSCGSKNGESSRKSVKINFTEDTSKNLLSTQSDSTHPLNLAISAMTSPQETYVYYEKLVKFISQKLDRRIQFKQRKSYEEVNQLLKTGEVDIAFICSGAYIAAKPENYMEIIAVPVVNGQPYYHAYIIVHKDSHYEDFSDLKGSSFAFTDPLSNTGYFYPVRRVRELGYSVNTFFSKVMFTYAHDHSIQAVSRKIVAAASVDGLIYDYLKEHNPELVKHTRIIEKSEPFGIPPVVVPSLLPSRLKNRLKEIFLNLHKDPEGVKILQKLNIDRFVSKDSTGYDMVEKNMRSTLQ